MGRKKRPKVDNSAPPVPEPQIPTSKIPPPSLPASIPRDPRRAQRKERGNVTDIFTSGGIAICLPVDGGPLPPHKLTVIAPPVLKAKEEKNESVSETKDSSGYAMTSHSADLITEDIYVSDGSEDEADGNVDSEPLELTLTASKMGLMRRGLRGATMFQPKTWTRSDDIEKEEVKEDAKEVSSDDEKDETKDMDPAQRAAYLLVEKQQKLEEAEALKRKLESSENAGRDPCLFSKRTAFDIRMDQIEEKPWDRETGGTGDITDYFNYGMSEEDWFDYSERQKLVRQELTDAGRQRRMPDPTIVPVAPKAPTQQTPRVAVAIKKTEKDENAEEENTVGPVLPEPKEIKAEGRDGDGGDGDGDKAENEDTSAETPKIVKDVSGLEGGAWGIPPGSKIAKLIEEQERYSNAPPPPPSPRHMPPPPQHEWNNNRGNERFHHNADGYRGSQNTDSYGGNKYTDTYGGNKHTDTYGGNKHTDTYGGNRQQHDFQQPNHYSPGSPSSQRIHGGDSWRGGRGGRGFHPGRGGPPGRGYGPPGGRGFMQQQGGRFHGGRGFHRGGGRGRGGWRRY